MTIRMSPKYMERVVYEALALAVHGAVDLARDVAVDRAVDVNVAVAVWRAVDLAVQMAPLQAVRFGPPHPNLDRFLTGVRRTQARWGAA